MGVAKGVGKEIRMDPITVEMIKARYARVCVELDLNDPFTNRVKVGMLGRILTIGQMRKFVPYMF